MNKQNIKNYLESDIVEIYTENNGERFIHFLGYGYREESEGKYCFCEYVHNIIPVDVFILGKEENSGDYNEIYNRGKTCYVEDCDETRLRYIYEESYGKKPLPTITRKTAASLPDGFYLWPYKTDCCQPEKTPESEDNLVSAFRDKAAETVSALIDKEWTFAEIQSVLREELENVFKAF